MINLNPKSKLFLLIFPFSCILLITLFSSLTIVTNNRKSSTITPHIHVHKNLQVGVAHSACVETRYPSLCVATLSKIPDLHTKTLPEIMSSNVNFTVSECRDSASYFSRLYARLYKKVDPRDRLALTDCLELLDETVQELKKALSDLSLKHKSPEKHYAELQTLLSAAMTNQNTCLDGFAYSKKNVRKYLKRHLKNISHHVSNALAMLKKMKKKNKKNPERREVFEEYGEMKNGFPSWLKKKERGLLEQAVNETVYDLVVAKDGSGNFTTVNEAIYAAPNNSDTRFVIYIKEGAYFEYIEVIRKKPNIMLVGDGIGKTWIKGNRSVVDGWTTFRSATVAAVGNHFIAKGISFENFAGPSKHQAVALRSGSDLSAFYQCSFIGYQDTLYVHTLRQFYRECDIYGTVDFIFGNAAVVFQNCNLYARKPNLEQKNMYTAQGRDDPNQNTGISILGCKIAAAADLIPEQSLFKTYLGRPWKEFSRTVVQFSYIGDLVEPAGWLEWSGEFALNTLYYAEYSNRGPGSNTSARVAWPGYKVINDSVEASQFTVDNFLQGGEWLPDTGIPFYLNLTATS